MNRVMADPVEFETWGPGCGLTPAQKMRRLRQALEAMGTDNANRLIEATEALAVQAADVADLVGVAPQGIVEHARFMATELHDRANSMRAIMARRVKP